MLTNRLHILKRVLNDHHLTYMLGIFHLLVVLRAQALLLCFGRSYALMLPLHAQHVHI